MSLNLTPMTRLPSEQAEVLEEALTDIYECLEAQVNDEAAIKNTVDAKIRPNILQELKEKNLVSTESGRVRLSPEGEQLAKRTVRRKRLAERLLKDVLNLTDDVVSPAACQWEHILSKEVTDSICTLLGHPSVSPSDAPIPPGECCRTETKATGPLVCSLEKLAGGDRGKITYLLAQKNPDLHRLLSMGLTPGKTIEVLQTYPTFVVHVDETQIAFDSGIAESIFVHPLAS